MKTERAPAADPAKLELLYRLPLASPPGRTLELLVQGNALLTGQAWAGELATQRLDPRAAEQRLPFDNRSFDYVVLHRSLDIVLAHESAARRRLAADRLLGEVARVLADGGIAAGAVGNRYGMRRVAGGVEPGAFLSVPGCSRALTRAGFRDLHLFSLLPDSAEPTRLLSIEPGWSPRACLRHAEARRPLVKSDTYLVWRVLAALGLSQYMGTATFFWGAKR